MSEDEPVEKKDAHLTPQVRAMEKIAELRMHSELAAVFEGIRKFDAQLVTLDPDVARDVQRAMAKFEKAKIENTPVLDPSAIEEAERILRLPDEKSLATNDYHVYRRPGETMIVRWLAADEVDTFFSRYQAHCDAALDGIREDERSALEWRGDDKTQAYLEALDKAELKVEGFSLREQIRKHGLFALATTAADAMNIRFLCNHLLGVEEAELVGKASAPDDDATQEELSWYFKLFILRGTAQGEERICAFTYLQKTDDSFGF